MPRKTASGVDPEARHERASMRPRPDAAENLQLFTRLQALAYASMRPRPDAAENTRCFDTPSTHSSRLQ